MNEALNRETENLPVTRANNGANRIKIIDDVATSGNFAKRPAIRRVKIATTSKRHKKQNDKNSCLPVIPSIFSITYETERPLFLMDITRAAKSWKAPTNTQPTRIQIKAGSQPKYAAMIGPTIGPGPAIDAK